MVMKIWVDDIRTPPQDGTRWTWAMSSHEAIYWLEEAEDSGDDIEIMSLDHDLGGDDTTRPIVLWCCENDFWPVEVVCHSQNPVGRSWIEEMVWRYKS